MGPAVKPPVDLAPEVKLVRDKLKNVAPAERSATIVKAIRTVRAEGRYENVLEHLVELTKED